MRMGMGCAALAAVAMVAAEPCLAASLGDDEAGLRGRVGAFAGASLAFPLGSPGHSVASARLQLSPAYAYYDGRGFGLVQRRGGGVELGLNGPGKLDLLLAGRTPAQMKQTLGFKGSTGYIVVGGLLVVVLLLAAYNNASPKPGPR